MPEACENNVIKEVDNLKTIIGESISNIVQTTNNESSWIGCEGNHNYSCTRTLQGTTEALNFHISSENPITNPLLLSSKNTDEVIWITLSRTLNNRQYSNSEVFGFYLKNGCPEYIRKCIDLKANIHINSEEDFIEIELQTQLLILSKISEFLNEFIQRMK